MNARTTGLVAIAIDSAIQKAGEAEYQRLSDGLSLGECKSRVQLALNSLRLLQSGEQPEYTDEWVALFYTLWYQPKQINLAYGMIKKMLSLRNSDSFILNPNGQLHVIDLGCGALAMQFVVALAATDAIAKGQNIKQITIHSSDTSQIMIDLGRKLWQQFQVEPSVTPSMDQALSLIEPQYDTSLPDFFREQFRGIDYWVSAIHALYEDNTDAIRHALGRTQATRPTAMFTFNTCV